MAGVGLEYRYPFVAETRFGEQIIEPIAQIIVRPNEILPTLHPNEDAQSLVFDDTTLFNWSKYSGYDRVEGGTRANYGFQYVNNLPSGGHVNVVAGQSIQVAGQNSYTLPTPPTPASIPGSTSAGRTMSPARPCSRPPRR